MAYPGRYLGRDFERLRREMDRLFSDYQPARSSKEDADDEQQAVWAPRADLAETENNFIIALDVPGVSEDDLRLTLEEDTLKVSGERSFNREKHEGQFHRIERSYGRFFRAFRFGSPIDAQGVEASFDDGVLTVTVPKAEVSKPRRIEVRRSSPIGGAPADAPASAVQEAWASGDQEAGMANAGVQDAEPPVADVGTPVEDADTTSQGPPPLSPDYDAGPEDGAQPPEPPYGGTQDDEGARTF